MSGFTLTYEYNLANELTSITDPFNVEVNYTYDSVGRLSSVTGSGFADVSVYASQMEYRAWGAVKRMTYGNGQSLEFDYNSRQQIAHYELSEWGSGQTSLDYQYYADGRLKNSRDLVNSKFNRGYSYDQMGRLTTATSGPEALGGVDTDDRPYRQTYSFDAWSNMTNRTGKHWSKTSAAASSTYVNDRMQDGTYDADGRLTHKETLTFTFDAAGRRIRVTDTRPPTSTINSEYDGDGLPLKQGSIYYIRSSVLSGQTITELKTNGERMAGYVYANGRELGKQNLFLQRMVYEYHEPSGGRKASSYLWHDSLGNVEHVYNETQLDPMNDDVWSEDQYLDTGGNDGGGELESPFQDFGNANDLEGGCVVLDQPMNCFDAMYFSTRVGGVMFGLSTYQPFRLRTLETMFAHGQSSLSGNGPRLVSGWGYTGYYVDVYTEESTLVNSDSQQNQDGGYTASVTVTAPPSRLVWIEGQSVLTYAVLRPLIPPLRLTRDEVNMIRSDLNDLLSDKRCRELVAAIFGKLSKVDGYRFDTSDVSAIFEKAVDTGITWEDRGDVAQTRQISGDTPLYIALNPSPSKFPVGQTHRSVAVRAEAIIHELMHFSGTSSFGHDVLASAVNSAASSLGYNVGPVPKRSDYPFTPEGTQAFINALYAAIDGPIWEACYRGPTGDRK